MDDPLTPDPSPTRGEGSHHGEGQTHRSAPTEMREWWSFETWAEFMRWTFMNLQTDISLAKYEMPERIRRMRTAPNMVMSVLRGQSPEWAERQYAELKSNGETLTPDPSPRTGEGSQADAEEGSHSGEGRINVIDFPRSTTEDTDE